MSKDPFSKHAHGYATGTPLPGAGGMPDPYSMAGVHAREAQERREREARAASQQAIPQAAGPDLVLLTHPHREPRPFSKDQLIFYKFSCIGNYVKLGFQKRDDKIAAEKAAKAGYSTEDQKILNSKEYHEYVEKGLDLAEGFYYGVGRHETEWRVYYTPFLKPLKVFDGFITKAVGDPANYPNYLRAFEEFYRSIKTDRPPDKASSTYYAQLHFEDAHKIHQEITYLDHIELRKKISIGKFKKFMDKLGPEDRKARKKRKIRNIVVLFIAVVFVIPMFF